MITNIKSITIYVSDQDKAVDFYVNKLGWEKRNDIPYSGGIRWIEVAPPDAQTVLTLVKGFGDWSHDKVSQYRGPMLHTDDVYATYETLRKRGVHFTESVSEQPWGQWTQLVDQDGTPFYLGSNRTPTGRPLISHIHASSIYVTAPDKAVDFYVNKLGFIKQTDAPMGDQRWIELALPGAETILLPISHFSDWSPERIGGFSRMVLDCDNCQATYEELAAKGVEFIEKPNKQFFGLVQAQFLDQDGNRYPIIGS